MSTTKDLNDGPLSNLVDNDFTSMVRTVSSTKNYRYFTIDLKTAVPVVSIYAVSCHFNFEDNPYAERYYKNEVYVGNSSDRSDKSSCGKPLGTGTLECSNPKDARYVFIRNHSSASGNRLEWCDFRVYGLTNLTKTATVVKSIQNDPSYGNLVASNLVQDVDKIIGNSSYSVAFDGSGGYIYDHYSCYRVRAQDFYQNNDGVFELTF